MHTVFNIHSTTWTPIKVPTHLGLPVSSSHPTHPPVHGLEPPDWPDRHEGGQFCEGRDITRKSARLPNHEIGAESVVPRTLQVNSYQVQAEGCVSTEEPAGDLKEATMSVKWCKCVKCHARLSGVLIVSHFNFYWGDKNGDREEQYNLLTCSVKPRSALMGRCEPVPSSKALSTPSSLSMKGLKRILVSSLDLDTLPMLLSFMASWKSWRPSYINPVVSIEYYTVTFYLLGELTYLKLWVRKCLITTIMSKN